MVGSCCIRHECTANKHRIFPFAWLVFYNRYIGRLVRRLEPERTSPFYLSVTDAKQTEEKHTINYGLALQWIITIKNYAAYKCTRPHCTKLSAILHAAGWFLYTNSTVSFCLLYLEFYFILIFPLVFLFMSWMVQNAFYSQFAVWFIVRLCV